MKDTDEALEQEMIGFGQCHQYTREQENERVMAA